MKCIVCDETAIRYAWTDTHGVAQCMRCGTPYTIFHYEGIDGSRRRVEKPPEALVDERFVPVLRAYWEQHHRYIPSNHSFPGSTQELASLEDSKFFYEWMQANADRYLPPR